MEIKYRGHAQRTEKSKEKWIAIVNDYNSGMSIKELRDKYRNPNTGKRCTIPYIYWVFKRVESLK